LCLLSCGGSCCIDNHACFDAVWQPIYVLMFCVMLYFTNHANGAPVSVCSGACIAGKPGAHAVCMAVSCWVVRLARCPGVVSVVGTLPDVGVFEQPLWLLLSRGSSACLWGAVDVHRGGALGLFALERVVWMPHGSARVCVSRCWRVGGCARCCGHLLVPT
jgi:hypothetical protein